MLEMFFNFNKKTEIFCGIHINLYQNFTSRNIQKTKRTISKTTNIQQISFYLQK